MDVTNYVKKHYSLHPDIAERLKELLAKERIKRYRLSETALVNELLAKALKI